MKYGLAIHCKAGIVLCADIQAKANKPITQSDTRMNRYTWPGNRFITFLSYGNATVIDELNNQLNKDLTEHADKNLLSLNTLQEIADYIAEKNSIIQKGLVAKKTRENVNTSYLLAGQIGQQATETMLIYAQGNYINDSDYFPFLQIGEYKYGKPILDRAIKKEMDLNLAARCAMVSMLSTNYVLNERNNAIELIVYENNSLSINKHKLYLPNDDFSNFVGNTWNDGLNNALLELPKFYWE
jgi:putative proteasome-type protease